MNLLIDGSNILWRAHWMATKGPGGDKTQENRYYDVYMFLNMIKGYKKIYPQSDVWIVWDKKIDRHLGNPRHEHIEGYKAGRSDASDVFANCEIIVEISKAIGIHHFYPSHLEADDAIGWLSRQLPKSIIFSADQDLLQLINENVYVYNINKKAVINHLNYDRFMATHPDIFALYKSIVGDPSDNIIGIPGYGKKRGAKLANNWETTKVTDDIKLLVEKNLKLIDISANNAFIDTLELQRYNEQFEECMGPSTKDVPKFTELLTQYNQQAHLKKMKEWTELFNNSDINKLLSKLDILK